MTSSIEGLLNIASKVGTPLALSGIIVIVLYALYKQVLALNLFAPIGAGRTSHLLQNVLNKLFWLALVALILGVASYVVTALFPHGIPSRSVREKMSGNIIAGRDVINAPGAIMQTGPGSAVTQMLGVPPKEYACLAKELGVTESALESFFTILEQKHVPPKELDSTLRHIAKTYKELQTKLQTFTSDDPTVVTLKEEASKALEASDFPRVETLLKEARAKDIEAAKQMQEIAIKRRLSAAATNAELGTLKMTQVAYAEAASYYRQAAELVPEESGEVLATYLDGWGIASYQAGDYPQAALPLQQALTILEQALGPMHPRVAVSLNNLAELSRDQGQYAHAEPHYQRALTILEQALGPMHSDVAVVLNNLALLYAAQGQYTQAEPHYRRALTILEQALDPMHPRVAIVGGNYAALLRATHRDAEAVQLEEQLLAHQPPRAWLGIQIKRSTKPPGLFVEQVIADSPAAHAGIQPHDVIVRFNAQQVPDPETFLRLVGAVAIGTTVNVEIIHDSERRTIPVTLEKRPLSRP